jgi:hypothetical protein
MTDDEGGLPDMANKVDLEKAPFEETRDEQNEAKKEERFDYDSFWKSLIKKYFYLLLKRALPDLYAKADTGREPIFLDKEFQDLLNTGDPRIHKHPHFADMLADVPLIEGDMERVLLHAEAQGKGGRSVAERMYHYKCLIYGHYRREPVALVIVTDKRSENEPRFYEHRHFGTRSLYEYNEFILAELNDEELQRSDNPINLVLYAAKKSAECKEDLQKYHFLRLTTGLLSERGWDREEKRNLLNFIGWILYLEDEDLSEQYKEYLHELAEEGKIVYIPFYERKDAEKVRLEGREEMANEMAKNLLANGVPPEIIAKSAGLPVEKIQALIN